MHFQTGVDIKSSFQCLPVFEPPVTTKLHWKYIGNIFILTTTKKVIISNMILAVEADALKVGNMFFQNVPNCLGSM